MVDHLKHALEAWGPRARIAYARWAPTNTGSGAQTLVQGQVQGIASIVRNGAAGSYTVNLKDKCKDMAIVVGVVEDDTTHFHFARVESMNPAAGTFVVSHKSVAFASVASGPTGSDTVDQLTLFIVQRMFD
jgi:hypothetical protein